MSGGDRYVGTGHLLIGMMYYKNSVLPELLEYIEIDISEVRNQIKALIDETEDTELDDEQGS